MAKKTNKIKTDEDGCPILRGELFFRWKAVDNEVLNTELSLRLKQIEIDALMDKYPEVKNALNERQYIIGRSVQAQSERSQVYKEIEAYLGMPLKNVSIDDVSGRVHVHELSQAPTVAPAKPKSADHPRSRRKK